MNRQPITRDVLQGTKVSENWRDFFDYLQRRVNVSKRQTVQSGSVDSDGYANFLSAGTGLNVDLSAATTPVSLTFANGFDENGAVNYSGYLNRDYTSRYAGLTANATNFLYESRNPRNGQVSSGFTVNLPPIYGTTYNNAGGVGQSVNLFEGTDGETACTDENANVTWAFSGNAQIDTGVTFLGENSLLLDGTGDYITSSGLTLHAGTNEGGFSIDGWFYTTGTGIDQVILQNTTNFHLALVINTSDILELSLGNGSSWSIALSSAGSTTLSTSTKYWYNLQWDGSTYKVYLGTSGASSEEISVSSSTAFSSTTDEFRVGAGVGGAAEFVGNVGLIRYNVGPRTNSAPTVPTTAYSGLAMDGERWFDLGEMKMKAWNNSTGVWDEKQEVFTGEAVTDGSSVTSVVTYGLRGEYDSGWFDVVAATDYDKDHNLGFQEIQFVPEARDATKSIYGYLQYYQVAADFGGNLARLTRKSYRLGIHTNPNFIDGSNSGTVVDQARIRIIRNW